MFQTIYKVTLRDFDGYLKDCYYCDLDIAFEDYFQASFYDKTLYDDFYKMCKRSIEKFGLWQDIKECKLDLRVKKS